MSTVSGYIAPSREKVQETEIWIDAAECCLLPVLVHLVATINRRVLVQVDLGERAELTHPHNSMPPRSFSVEAARGKTKR